MVSVFSDPFFLFSLRFSPCGTFLYVGGREKREDITIPFHRDLGTTVAGLPLTIPQNAMAHSRIGTDISARHGMTLAALGSLPLEAGKAIVSRQNGRTAVSVLKQTTSGASNAIALQHMRDDGGTHQDDLILLPKSTAFEHSRTTLLPLTDSSSSGEDNKPVISLVINKAVQDVYAVDGTTDLRLPLLVSRTVDSIPTVVRKRPVRSIEDG